MLERHTEQKPHLLEARIIEGLEKRLCTPTHPPQLLREIYELRAIGRDLISHINALEGMTHA